jgi:Cu(I)/Ag(I) efflux system periplasmic protein CusF
MMAKLIVAALLVGFAAFAWFSLPTVDRQVAHGEGLVVSIDRRAQEVTISHGALPALGMPPMTMVFEVAKPEELRAIQPGDRVRFALQVEGEIFTVMQIEKAD